MEFNRIYEVLNNDKKVDIYYQERPVWIQGIHSSDNVAKVGFVDNFEEKDVSINELYEREISN